MFCTLRLVRLLVKGAALVKVALRGVVAAEAAAVDDSCVDAQEGGMCRRRGRPNHQELFEPNCRGTHCREAAADGQPRRRRQRSGADVAEQPAVCIDGIGDTCTTGGGGDWSLVDAAPRGSWFGAADTTGKIQALAVACMSARMRSSI